MRFGVIMAGGAGTRLWPMSRHDRPKQLLPLIPRPGRDRPASLLEIAAERLEGLVEPQRRYVCTAERYRPLITDALPGFTSERILGEPVGRDTVNAVGFAAAVFEKLDPDAVFVVLTADHLIEPEEVFAQRVDLGFRLVEDDPGRLVTFSIKPTYPATGYGYVERADPIMGIPGGASDTAPLAFGVARFVEKPPRQKAQAYLDAGNFAWNSGMFVFHAATFMETLERFKPECYEGLRRIQSAWGGPDQREVIDEVYPNLPKTSVDYAVMEPASRDRRLSLCTVVADVKWADVGSWPAFADTLAPDKQANRAPPGTAALPVESGGNLVVSDDANHTIALLGCRDLVVVHTRDATLVVPKDRAEDLKTLHAELPDHLK